LALSVPLSRFTSRVGGGSAFFVRPLHTTQNMKTTTLSLILIFLASACASKAQDVPTAKPKFVIMAGDVVSTSVELVTNRVPSTAVVHLEFTSGKAAEFRKFTQQHLKQTVQILVGTNVVATPVIQSEIPSKKIYLDFPTREEAARISNYLMTK